jgi:hypothetical protein
MGKLRLKEDLDLLSAPSGVSASIPWESQREAWGRGKLVTVPKWEAGMKTEV